MKQASLSWITTHTHTTIVHIVVCAILLAASALETWKSQSIQQNILSLKTFLFYSRHDWGELMPTVNKQHSSVFNTHDWHRDICGYVSCVVQDCNINTWINVVLFNLAGYNCRSKCVYSIHEDVCSYCRNISMTTSNVVKLLNENVFSCLLYNTTIVTLDVICFLGHCHHHLYTCFYWANVTHILTCSLGELC